ncbi:MAG: tRNA (adenosine(37)-N6)-threonylcarbamoyltransferase complex ATPase subunit type 1 TsaE [Clostridia bacterium]|nr:tRNA (adenosine(37)-N6)-threonylcarbamoyltransferase complex ATPase subunit type 1 TsaE [Clostridia bacterium]
MQEIICNNENQTKLFASNLAKTLNVGDVIVLSGELGAGKTKFVEGILNYFGLQNEISSPTFTIVNEYHNEKIDIFHFDLYRLGDVYEFENIGGEEYFDKGICIFEWGELIEDILPDDYIKISFDTDEEDVDMRKLTIETFGDKYKDIDFNKFLA